MRNLDVAAVKYDERGLVPVITQDAHTKDVLMLAYANRETLMETLEIGKMVYFSRSRNQRWFKGETSGNVQDLVSLSLDCDGDTVLALVHTSGPACHNGTSTCFEED
jgi:phosphoribosyl-ATP pyrophosphohydrolase/phosphoribosyl-AMP cyclohydrolase